MEALNGFHIEASLLKTPNCMMRFLVQAPDKNIIKICGVGFEAFTNGMRANFNTTYLYDVGLCGSLY